MILKTVIEGSGVTNRPGDLEADCARIREGLAKLDNYDGVVGPTSFDEHGDRSGKATVLVVKDGKFEKVEY